MNKKTVIFTLITALSITAYTLYKRNNSSLKNVNRDARGFVVGVAAGYAPFVSINSNGEYEGFDIDIAHAIADKMGKKLELKDLGSMTSLFMALEQGSIDAIIWALSITQDRLAKVAMVHYQGETTRSYPLIFWKEIPANVQTLQDIKDITVCVEPTSAQSTVLEKYTTNIHPTEKVDDALLMLQYGKAGAAFVEPAIAQKFKKSYPEIQILEIPLEKEDQVEGMGIAIKKDNITLIEQVKRAVQELKDSGTIREYETKWSIV